MKSFVPLTWDNLVGQMLQEFPNLNSEFRRIHYGFDDWTPGQYSVFGDVFIKYMETEATQSKVSSIKLGNFLERMAASRVVNIEDLLKIDVLPALLTSQSLIDHYWPYVGPRVEQMLRLLAPEMRNAVVLPPRV